MSSESADSEFHDMREPRGHREEFRIADDAAAAQDQERVVASLMRLEEPVVERIRHSSRSLCALSGQYAWSRVSNLVCRAAGPDLIAGPVREQAMPCCAFPR